MGLVNLSTRVPLDDDDLCDLDASNINSASDFIEVCYKYQSDAASMNNADHSAYKVGSSYPYYGTPSYGSQILCSGIENAGYCSTASPNVDHFAYIGDVTVTGSSSLSAGTTYTYTLANLPSAVTIKNVSVNTFYATVEETNATNFKIKAQNSTTNLQITVYLETSCSGSTSRYRTKTVSITSSGGNACNGGTINGSTLYTFNGVSSTSNTVAMNATNWNWSITSGYASYSTSNAGQILNFNLYSGCVTFSAYKSGCGTRTYTFCRYSFFTPGDDPNAEQVTSIEIYDIRSGRQVKSMECDPCSYTNEELTEDLPFGIYVIARNGLVEKFAKMY